MAEHSTIEWTDATWNVITGCTLVSEGCRHCYAAGLAATRLKHIPSREGLARINAAGEAKFTGEVRFNEQWLDQPLRWRRPRMIFVCAHGDLFHENAPDDWIDRVFAVMALAPQHAFQVLTKRPARARAYLTGDAQSRIVAIYATRLRARARGEGSPLTAFDIACDKVGLVKEFDHADIVPRLEDRPLAAGWPLPNVWIGTSVEDQATADERIPHLLATPAAVRFVSAEPLLGPVDLTSVCTGWHYIHCLDGFKWHDTDRAAASEKCAALDWVIVGGESGHGARPMHPDWARSLRDQCQAAGVPFFFKQWGEWALSLDRDRDDPDWRADYSRNYVDRGKSRWLNLEGGRGFHGDRFCVMMRIGKRAAGRLLDGAEWNQMPEATS